MYHEGIESRGVEFLGGRGEGAFVRGWQRDLSCRWDWWPLVRVGWLYLHDKAGGGDGRRPGGSKGGKVPQHVSEDAWDGSVRCDAVVAADALLGEVEGKGRVLVW